MARRSLAQRWVPMQSRHGPVVRWRCDCGTSYGVYQGCVPPGWTGTPSAALCPDCSERAAAKADQAARRLKAGQ